MFQEEEELPSLNIKDKVNYPYLLASQILTYQKATLNLDFSDREIKEAIEGFVQMIPDSWKDEDWDKALKKSEIKESIDVRPEFCGVKPSLEYCKENGITAFIEKKTFDSMKLFHACINLLDRRGLISKVSRVEKVLGDEWDGER